MFSHTSGQPVNFKASTLLYSSKFLWSTEFIIKNNYKRGSTLITWSESPRKDSDWSVLDQVPIPEKLTRCSGRGLGTGQLGTPVKVRGAELLHWDIEPTGIHGPSSWRSQWTWSENLHFNFNYPLAEVEHFLFFFFFLVGLEFELRTSCLQIRPSTAWATTPVHFCFGVGSHELFA
jgi:hypothetical protein